MRPGDGMRRAAPWRARTFSCPLIIAVLLVSPPAAQSQGAGCPTVIDGRLIPCKTPPAQTQPTHSTQHFSKTRAMQKRSACEAAGRVFYQSGNCSACLPAEDDAGRDAFAAICSGALAADRQ